MSEAKRRIIKQLRALADSTTFPAEAASARAKADKLEAALGGPESRDILGRANQRFDPQDVRSAYAQQASDAQRSNDLNSYMRTFTEEHWQRMFDQMVRGRR